MARIARGSFAPKVREVPRRILFLMSVMAGNIAILFHLVEFLRVPVRDFVESLLYRKVPQSMLSLLHDQRPASKKPRMKK